MCLNGAIGEWAVGTYANANHEFMLCDFNVVLLFLCAGSGMYANGSLQLVGTVARSIA